MEQNTHISMELEWLYNKFGQPQCGAPGNSLVLLGKKLHIERLMRELRTTDGRISYQAIYPVPEILEGEVVIGKEAEPLNPSLARRRSELRSRIGYADKLEFRLKWWGGQSHDMGEDTIRSKSAGSLRSLIGPDHWDMRRIRGVFRHLGIPTRNIHGVSVLMNRRVLESVLGKDGNQRLSRMAALECHECVWYGNVYVLSGNGIEVTEEIEESLIQTRQRAEDRESCNAAETASSLFAIREFLGSWIKLVSVDVREKHRHLLEIGDILAEAKARHAGRDEEGLFDECMEEKLRTEPIGWIPDISMLNHHRRHFRTIDIEPPPEGVIGHMAVHALGGFHMAYKMLERTQTDYRQPSELGVIAEMARARFGELAKIYEAHRNTG